MQRTLGPTRMLLLLVCIVLAPGRAAAQYPPPPAPEAPAMAQVRAGDALMTQGDYRGAAGQYEAAYAIDPALSILERMADAYRLAGDSARAADLYQRIAALRGEVAPQAQPYIAPAPLPQPVYYSRTPAVRRPGQGLINTGLALFISGYGVAVVGGAITMGATYASNGSSSWYGAGGMLFIPVAGPFATIAYNSNLYWAAPWAVISGGLQLSGLGLLIAGAVIRAQSKNAPPRPVAARAFDYTFSPYTTTTGGGLVFSARF